MEKQDQDFKYTPSLARRKLTGDTGSDSSSQSDDEERGKMWRRLFPVIETSRVATLSIITLCVLGLTSIGVVALASQAEDTGTSVVQIVSAALGAAAASVGIICAYFRDRGGLMWAFLLLLWSMSNSTSFLYTGIRDANRIRSLCTERPEQSGTATDPFGEVCDRGKLLTLAQVIVSIVGFGCSFISAWLVYTLSEKLQDDHNNERRKDELAVALESAHSARKLSRRLAREILGLKARQRTMSQNGGGYPQSAMRIPGSTVDMESYDP